MGAHWISAEEALERMGVKRQTLYAYASRGLITNRQDEQNPRRSLYAAEDVARLTQAKAGPKRASSGERQGPAAEPAKGFDSSLTVVSEGKLYYLGHDVMSLAEKASFEEAARLMWRCDEDPFAGLAPHPQVAIGPDAKTRAFSLLAHRAARDPAAHGRSALALQREAASLLVDLVDALAGTARSGPLHERLARSWRLESNRSDIIRRALVLAMDHEISPSTLAVRMTASTGASLAATLSAGLAALSGPLHGGMPAQVAGFVVEARRQSDPQVAAAQRLAQGLEVPGFGHPSHPDGDPRAKMLAQGLRWSDEMQEIAAGGQAVTGQAPNFDFALTAMARTLGLPSEAPMTLVIAARAAGWLAHALEQRASGAPLMPRARYVGPEPGDMDRRRPANDAAA